MTREGFSLIAAPGEPTIVMTRDFNAPRFTHYYRNHLIPLIEKGNGTLRDLLRMLSDKDFRAGIVAALLVFGWSLGGHIAIQMLHSRPDVMAG